MERCEVREAEVDPSAQDVGSPWIGVAHTDVERKGHEALPTQLGHHGQALASVRGTLRCTSGRLLDPIPEVVAEVELGRVAQRLEDRVSRQVAQRDVEVLSGACSFEAQFERVPTLQPRVLGKRCHDARQKPLHGDPLLETAHVLIRVLPPEPVRERPAERRAVGVAHVSPPR